MTWTPDTIRALRQAHGWSRRELGEHVARSWRTVEAWEQGRYAPDTLAGRELSRLAKRRPTASVATTTPRAGPR